MSNVLVLGVRWEHLKILGTVISPVPVPMMDNLARTERTAKLPLHH